jgi:hypothetical protein
LKFEKFARFAQKLSGRGRRLYRRAFMPERKSWAVAFLSAIKLVFLVAKPEPADVTFDQVRANLIAMGWAFPPDRTSQENISAADSRLANGTRDILI